MRKIIGLLLILNVCAAVNASSPSLYEKIKSFFGRKNLQKQDEKKLPLMHDKRDAYKSLDENAPMSPSEHQQYVEVSAYFLQRSKDKSKDRAELSKLKFMQENGKKLNEAEQKRWDELQAKQKEDERLGEEAKKKLWRPLNEKDLVVLRKKLASLGKPTESQKALLNQQEERYRLFAQKHGDASRLHEKSMVQQQIMIMNGTYVGDVIVDW